MKKLYCLVLTGILITLCACGGGGGDTQSEEPASQAETSQEAQSEAASEEANSDEKGEKETFGIDDEWVVDGIFKLKIDSVKPTDERNEFEEKDPAEVVVVTYSYENLGYEGDGQDLFISPERVIDGSGEVASSYPAGAENFPQPTPVGAKMVGAEESFGLNNESENIKVLFSIYDDNGEMHEATFEVPVTK